METAKTLAVLKALADGIDPATGEHYPAGSAYQHPDTVRALFSAIGMLGNAAPPASPKPGTAGKAAPENSGRPWSEEDDARLGKAYDAGKSIEELAGMHKRSKWAIEARLVRLGKIPEPPSRFPARNASGNTATA
jgi:hypothetical protein